MTEIITTETEWMWNVTMSDEIKKGRPVFPQFEKQIFKTWVEVGWVKEKGAIEQLSLFN